MKRFSLTIARLVTALMILFAGLAAAPSYVYAHSQQKIQRLAFHDAMRKLWEGHITWTRLYIVSAAAGLPDQTLTAQRLLQNQTDIGNAIKPFYGEQAGDKLTALLRDHILIAAQIITDAKSGNTAAFATDKARWYANADDIAVFLHNANPKYWSLEMMREMMRTHLDLTLKEASDRLTGNYAGDIADYDRVHVEILSMADMLSNGIIRQFRSQFDD